MKESDIQRAIIDYLHLVGCYAIKIQSGAAINAMTGTFIQMAEKGTPDLIVSRKPFIRDDRKCFEIGFVEVKTPVGRLSDAQIYRLRDLHKRGHSWCVATSIDDIKRWLDDVTYHGPTKLVDKVFDEDNKFVFKPTRGNKLSMSAFNEYTRWADKRDISPNESNIPF